MCHGLPQHTCHADAIIAAYTKKFPDVFDREVLGACSTFVSRTEQIGRVKKRIRRGSLDRYRLETGSPSRRLDAGQWRTDDTRQMARGQQSQTCTRARRMGMASLLAPLLLGCVEKCSSDEQAISHLKRQVVERLSEKRLELKRDPEDR